VASLSLRWWRGAYLSDSGPLSRVSRVLRVIWLSRPLGCDMPVADLALEPRLCGRPPWSSHGCDGVGVATDLLSGDVTDRTRLVIFSAAGGTKGAKARGILG
jgi:hypothetical protein